MLAAPPRVGPFSCGAACHHSNVATLFRDCIHRRHARHSAPRSCEEACGSWPAPVNTFARCYCEVRAAILVSKSDEELLPKFSERAAQLTPAAVLTFILSVRAAPQTPFLGAWPRESSSFAHAGQIPSVSQASCACALCVGVSVQARAVDILGGGAGDSPLRPSGLPCFFSFFPMPNAS